MKKTFVFLLVACLTLLSGVTAFAETAPPGDAGITIVDWTDSSMGQNPDSTGIGGNAAVPVLQVPAGNQPISVETVTENGVLLIKKTYEVPRDLDPQTLVQAFEQDGYSFEALEILSHELPGETLTRPASKIAVTESDTDKDADILPHFPATIDYEEDGYTGQLHLDGSTYKTEADRHESYTYSYNKTREIPGLDRNDPALIEKEWNGMILSGVSFKQGYDGRYTATAIYKGTATGKRATAFTTTATYYGEITKTVPGNMMYTVIYEGVPLRPPVVLPAGDAEPEAPEQAGPVQKSDPPAKGGINPLYIALTGVPCLLLGGIIIPKLQRLFRKKREESE